MILNLRGTSGSGKSTVGHYLVDTYAGKPIYEDGWNKGKPRLVGYQLPGDFQVLGSYKAAGGGLDTFSPHDRSQAITLITDHATQSRHLFFEALVISSTVPRYVELVNDLVSRGVIASVNDFVFAFMDTPAELCIQRVYQRNGGKPIKEGNIRTHHAYMVRVAQRLRDAGLRVETIHHERAFEDVEALYREAGWDPRQDQGSGRQSSRVGAQLALL
jgi:gluconate kinase